MNEEQAKGILVFVKHMAGLSNEEPSLADYKSFLTFTIRPLFQTEARRCVFKKYLIESPEDFLGKIYEFQAERKLNVQKLFLKSFEDGNDSLNLENVDLLKKASGLTKFLRQKFLWKISELEKCLSYTREELKSLYKENEEISEELAKIAKVCACIVLT